MHGHTVAFPPESVIFVLAGHCTHVRSRLYVPLGQSKNLILSRIIIIKFSMIVTLIFLKFELLEFMKLCMLVSLL